VVNTNIRGSTDRRRRKRVPKGSAERSAVRTRWAGIGRIIGIGTLALFGIIVALGVTSFIALLAGYEPPRHQASARRLRRFVVDHRAQLPAMISDHLLGPGAERIQRGHAWIRDKLG